MSWLGIGALFSAVIGWITLIRRWINFRRSDYAAFREDQEHRRQTVAEQQELAAQQATAKMTRWNKMTANEKLEYLKRHFRRSIPRE